MKRILTKENRRDEDTETRELQRAEGTVLAFMEQLYIRRDTWSYLVLSHRLRPSTKSKGCRSTRDD